MSAQALHLPAGGSGACLWHVLAGFLPSGIRESVLSKVVLLLRTVSEPVSC